jgi:hypothetical protein
MSRVTKGDLSQAIIQPDRSINEKNDGTLEGQVVYKCAKEDEYKLPQIKDDHPDDARLECYNITKTHNSNGIITATASFFGLNASVTEAVISYSGAQNNEPIETHPEFITDLAGTVDSPKNGAVFVEDDQDPEYGTFIKFGGGEDDTKTPAFRGVEYYLTPSTQITLSYWTDKVPDLKDRLFIYEDLGNIPSRQFKVPPDVKDFLLLDTPYRQVGSFYQVTEQYLGSGPDGWNDKIYTRANA